MKEGQKRKWERGREEERERTDNIFNQVTFNDNVFSRIRRKRGREEN